MSHIDRALRISEGQGKTPPDRPSHRSGLDQYRRETPAVEPKHVRPAAEPIERSPRAERPVRVVHPAFRPDAELAARMITGDSGAVPVEQYRRLAAALHEHQLQQGLKSLTVTSALPDEGKTLTVVNLALTLSESFARRVLVIDADLRLPSVHTFFGVDGDIGLCDALRSGDKPRLNSVSPRLSVLASGRTGPNPLAALSSPRMGALIEECASQFDWVLLDTPPVALMPDAQLLARLTRAVVLVIAAGATPAAAVTRAVEDLGPDTIIGTVLNRVDERQIPEAGYYAQYGA